MEDDIKTLTTTAGELLERGTLLKDMADKGVGSPEDLKEYVTEQAKYVEDVSRYLKEMPEAYNKHFDGINASLSHLKKYVGERPSVDTELTKGKVAKAFAKATLAALYGESAFTSEESLKEVKSIIKPGMLEREESTKRHSGLLTKDAIDTDLKPGGTYAGYLVNPIYERELLRYAPTVSAMAAYVRRLPMVAPRHSFPFMDGRSITKTRTSADESGSAWAKSTKMANASDGVTFASRVTITATTLATYIPWIDEFSSDIQINESLASLLMEAWLEALAVDLDYNIIKADSGGSDEYDGLLETSDVKTYQVASSDVTSLDPMDIVTGSLEIQKEERENQYVILHESVLAAMMRKKNAVGDYMFWSPPSGDKPARLGGYPYIECNQMPDYASLKPGEVFMAMANPRNLWVGEREGMEVRQFDSTIYSLEYQELFVRFRIRNGFKVVKPEAACLFKLAK
jgi:HK97 family phage major capsid protein